MHQQITFYFIIIVSCPAVYCFDYHSIQNLCLWSRFVPWFANYATWTYSTNTIFAQKEFYLKRHCMLISGTASLIPTPVNMIFHSDSALQSQQVFTLF